MKQHVYLQTVVSVSYKNPTKHVVLVQSIFISLKGNLSSPWCSWKITHILLNNNNPPCLNTEHFWVQNMAWDHQMIIFHVHVGFNKISEKSHFFHFPISSHVKKNFVLQRWLSWISNWQKKTIKLLREPYKEHSYQWTISLDMLFRRCFFFNLSLPESIIGPISHAELLNHETKTIKNVVDYLSNNSTKFGSN